MIVHYHLYKNAGSSVEKALEKAFPGAVLKFDDFVDPNNIYTAKDLLAALEKNPQIAAVTSHQLVPPADAGWQPIIFLRDPLLRAYSVYRYEHTRGGFGGAFNDFVVHRLGLKDDFSIFNFQCLKLANSRADAVEPCESYDADELLRRARLWLDAVPFAGRVEYFGKSMDEYSRLYADVLGGRRLEILEENVSTGVAEASKKLDEVKSKLDASVLEALLRRNAADYSLLEHCDRRFGGRYF